MHFHEKTHPMHGMRSWLIQRLQKPSSFKIAGQVIDNPFSFGCGYKNGGLSDNAMELLRKIFSFDYMGAAEFEFGAIPKSFKQIAAYAEEKKLISFSIPVTGPLYDGWTKTKKRGKGVIYVLCPVQFPNNHWEVNSDHVDGKEYATLVVATALKDSHDDFKEATLVAKSVFQTQPEDERDRCCGWLEIDNHFMFFSDYEMFASTCTLFGVTPCEKVFDKSANEKQKQATT